MVEQQQFTANDNTAAQTHTAGDSGLSGQNRMELYQDYNKTVGNTSTHEKSQSEQSSKDGKNDNFPKMDDIYAKTTSGGGTNGERSLGNQQRDDGKAQQGNDDAQDGRTQQGSDAAQDGRAQQGNDDAQDGRAQQGNDDAQDGRAQQGNDDAQDGRAEQGAENAHEPSHTDVQKGTDQNANSPREFNGRQDPYTREALEGKGTSETSGDGKAESQGDSGERKSEGEKPGSPRHDTQDPPVNRDGTTGGADEARNSSGDAQRQGSEGSEGGDSAQRQGNSDAQRQSAGTDRPQTRNLNSGSRQDSLNLDSQSQPSYESKQNAEQMMSAEETEDVDDDSDAQEAPDSPNQRSERSEQNERSNQRNDARDNVESELSKRSGNSASASETVEDNDEPGSPNPSFDTKDDPATLPVNQDRPDGRPNSPDQRFDPRNDLSHLSKQNAEQMMTGSETVDESDKPNPPNQRSDQRSNQRENSRNSLSDLSRQNAEQMMTGSETVEESDKPNSPDQRRSDSQAGRASGGADSQRQRSTRGIDVESTDAASPEQRQEDSNSRGQQSGPGRSSPKSFMYQQTENYQKHSSGQWGDSTMQTLNRSEEAPRQPKPTDGWVHSGAPQKLDQPDAPKRRRN